MVKLKKKFAVLFVVAIAALFLIPTAFAAEPTSYDGYKVSYLYGDYQSYTVTNGYVPGGNCWNCVDSYIGSYNYTNNYSYNFGVNYVYSQRGIGLAYHGVGVGSTISKWWENSTIR